MIELVIGLVVGFLIGIIWRGLRARREAAAAWAAGSIAGVGCALEAVGEALGDEDETTRRLRKQRRDAPWN